MTGPTRDQVEAICMDLDEHTQDERGYCDMCMLRWPCDAAGIREALRALVAGREVSNARVEEIRATLAEVVTGYHDVPTMAVLAVAEVKALREDKARLADELRNIADAKWRAWGDGMNTTEDFASWAQSRARAAIDAARRGDGA